MKMPIGYEFHEVNKPRVRSRARAVERTCAVCMRLFRTYGPVQHCSMRCERFEDAHFGRSYLALVLYNWRTNHA